jgi:hypothetical protein
MKKLFALILITSASISFANEPDDLDDGMYIQGLDSVINFFYQVDTIAQSCFVITTHSSLGGGVTETDCKKLANRPEWKNIITWIK